MGVYQGTWRLLSLAYILPALIGFQELALANVYERQRQVIGFGLNQEKQSSHLEKELTPPTLPNTCPLYSTNCTNGCCPLKKGVCCPDMEHCCPSATLCLSSSKTCLSPHRDGGQFHKLIPFRTVEKSAMPLARGDERFSLESKTETGPERDGNVRRMEKMEKPQRVFSKFCPDQRTMCQDDCTCCWMYTRCWGCCPYSNAVCCPDGKHCCPNGWTCNESTGYCQNTIDGTWIPATETQCGQKTSYSYRLMWQSVQSRKVRKMRSLK